MIVLGQELGADLLLLDNREPRLFSRSLNLNVIGTVGIGIMAWQKKLIADPEDIFHRLRLNGFWIDDGLLKHLKTIVRGKA